MKDVYEPASTHEGQRGHNHYPVVGAVVLDHTQKRESRKEACRDPDSGRENPIGQGKLSKSPQIADNQESYRRHEKQHAYPGLKDVGSEAGLPVAVL
jgi:hypothetical protein